MNQSRLKTVIIVVVTIYILILIRFMQWQIFQSNSLQKKALSQIYKLETIQPKKGKIYSSDNYLMVGNENYYLMSIYKPNLTKPFNEVMSQISKIKPEFSTKTEPSSKWYTYDTLFSKQEANTLKIDGITFEPHNTRYYPNLLSSNLITGNLGRNEQGHIIGIGGLEGFYNRQLSGKTGFIFASKDATGNIILNRKIWQTKSSDGFNLHTYISSPIQYFAEKALTDGIQTYSADSGSIIIMNPNTGGIIAMTSAIASESASSSGILSKHNASILDLFEPGSIFKPLVISMALETKSIKPDFICDKCSNDLQIGKYTITNHDKQHHPNSNLDDIIKNSDNLGMSNIIEKLGKNNFLEYYEKIGLKNKTGIDLQGETKPLFKTNWTPIDLATASFGQGFAITPIQMLQVFNIIANDGNLVKPKVVKYMENTNTYVQTKNDNKKIIFSKLSVDRVKEALKYGVENGALNQLRPKDIEVCGKSGTAQIAIEGEYTDNKTIASYIGFSPCNNPKFTMIVTLNNPKTSSWGSSTAAPIWFNIADKISNLL